MTARARKKEIEQEFKERLGWLVKPIIALDRRKPEFFRAPTTTTARLAKQMGDEYARRLAEVGEDGIAEDLLCCWLADEEVVEAFSKIGPAIEKRRERLVRRYLGTEILSLLDAAHASVKNAPLAVLRAPEKGLKAPAAYGKLIASRRLRGERRARALWDALGDICESVYVPYLKSLWVIAALANGKRPRPFPKLGQVVSQIPQLLESALVVNPLAARVRNAVQHDFTDYLVETDAIVLSNELDGRELWRDEFSIRELEILARDFVAAWTTLDEAVSYFNERAMHEAGFFDLFIDLRLAFKARDTDKVARLGNAMEIRSRNMFTEVHALDAFGRV